VLAIVVKTYHTRHRPYTVLVTDDRVVLGPGHGRLGP
jgi:hypothetical protein